MGIESTFNQSHEILKPSDLLSKSSQQFETIIVHFSNRTLKVLEDENLITEIEHHVFSSDSNEYKVYQHHSLSNTLVFKSPIKASSVVGFLEEITYVFSIKNIIMFGSSGVLDADITAGKIIVPSKAYRDEGTSYHYAKASDFIEITHCDYLIKILSQLNIECVSGGIWTTDAFYRETIETFNIRKQQGCIAVDMEMSAVQAFANFRGFNLYAFVYGADNLDASSWDKRILGELNQDMRLNCFMIASAIAKAISK